jgi:hypothetical protein
MQRVADLEAMRLAVYRQFATTGRAPSTTELADTFGMSPSEVIDGLRRLHDGRQLVLDDDDRIVLAHPFSSIPLGFAVMGRATLWWGGCAWDSMAIPHLVADEPEVVVSTRCPGCARPHVWVVNRDCPPEGDQVAHFLVPVAHMWDDIVTTCSHQRLFCSESCVTSWLRSSGNERGYVMDLATLWRLAQHWYDGRLTRDYVRREPEQALRYFRDVGLDGPFWSL